MPHHALFTECSRFRHLATDVQLVQVIIDSLVVLSPFALYPELGSLSIPATGLLTLFFKGLLELSKSFLDPFGNEGCKMPSEMHHGLRAPALGISTGHWHPALCMPTPQPPHSPLEPRTSRAPPLQAECLALCLTLQIPARTSELTCLCQSSILELPADGSRLEPFCRRLLRRPPRHRQRQPRQIQYRCAEAYALPLRAGLCVPLVGTNLECAAPAAGCCGTTQRRNAMPPPAGACSKT